MVFVVVIGNGRPVLNLQICVCRNEERKERTAFDANNYVNERVSLEVWLPVCNNWTEFSVA